MTEIFKPTPSVMFAVVICTRTGVRRTLYKRPTREDAEYIKNAMEITDDRTSHEFNIPITWHYEVEEVV